MAEAGNTHSRGLGLVDRECRLPFSYWVYPALQNTHSSQGHCHCEVQGKIHSVLVSAGDRNKSILQTTKITKHPPFWLTGYCCFCFCNIHLFSCAGSQSRHMGSSIFIVACGLLSCGMWDLAPDQGSYFLHWECVVLATGPLRKTLLFLFCYYQL